MATQTEAAEYSFWNLVLGWCDLAFVDFPLRPPPDVLSQTNEGVEADVYELKFSRIGFAFIKNRCNTSAHLLNSK
jgi:hypothetical protein